MLTYSVQEIGQSGPFNFWGPLQALSALSSSVCTPIASLVLWGHMCRRALEMDCVQLGSTPCSLLNGSRCYQSVLRDQRYCRQAHHWIKRGLE